MSRSHKRVRKNASPSVPKQCEIIVPANTYRPAGQCYSFRAVERLKIRDSFVHACQIHRRIIVRGIPLESVR